MAEAVPDTCVVFADDAGTEHPVAIPRLGHTNAEVRFVAYRWACHQVATGVWTPTGELRYRRLERIQ